jgi:hypothetical protein
VVRGSNAIEASVTRAPSKVPFFSGYRTDYIVSPDADRPSPQAYLVEQDAGFSLRPHFHQSHQFQVVVAGEGTLGPHRLTPGTVHYASPESGYGPIVAGPEGLSYFTLRAVTDRTASPLPDERHRMRSGLDKRQYTRVPPQGGWLSGEPALAVEIRDIISLDDHGLAAWLVRLPPGCGVQLGEAAAGRFHVVNSGALLAQGITYVQGAVVFTSGDDAPVDLRAAEQGAELLVVQFPGNALEK